MSLNTTAIIGSSKPPVRPLRKHAPGGDVFDERSMNSLFDFREKCLKELDDLRLQVTGWIGRLLRLRQNRLILLTWMFGIVDAHGVLNALVNIDSFVQNAE
ncbi:hypothetical protein [Acidovorax sp. HMWF029]|uniref:hypothetical protein n=1 Tax=Acidovorax sp. HMWF029 TaxID=2056863 RepID=UPI0011B23EAC|nr:hypothetical protein [Acidovorax sp. HMWF029]